MDKRNIRIGDWICDASNYNYVLRAGINEIQCAHIFTPTQFMKVEGTIRYVHELQHFLLDCGIYWDICDCGERRL
jgi:hypothetical protein